MRKFSDASLKSRVRRLAQDLRLSPQEVLQMYFLERLLFRLSKSTYANNVVLKGGLLIASMSGIARRTTMDMDATVVGIPMDEDSLASMIRNICAVEADDGIEFSFEHLSPIREADKYPNYRSHLIAKLGTISAPCKIDVTTGDAITPGMVKYPYQSIFEGTSIQVMSYPVETVLAEKFETVVRRNELNSRARDFYDIFLLLRMNRKQLQTGVLKDAILATAARRGSVDLMSRYRELLEAVRTSEYMRVEIWEPYARAHSFIGNLRFDEAVEAAMLIGDLAELRNI